MPRCSRSTPTSPSATKTSSARCVASTGAPARPARWPSDAGWAGDGMRVRVRDVSFQVRDDEYAAFWARVGSGDWEPDSFGILDHFLSGESTFVDIGAWIGPLTLYGASIAGT